MARRMTAARKLSLPSAALYKPRSNAGSRRPSTPYTLCFARNRAMVLSSRDFADFHNLKPPLSRTLWRNTPRSVLPLINYHFDEHAYLSANPDVAAAVQRGDLES